MIYKYGTNIIISIDKMKQTYNQHSLDSKQQPKGDKLVLDLIVIHILDKLILFSVSLLQ